MSTCIKFQIVAKGQGFHREFTGESKCDEDADLSIIATATMGAIAKDAKLTN